MNLISASTMVGRHRHLQERTLATTSGPRSKADVDPIRLALLEAGVAESKTHVEQMVLNFSTLLDAAFSDHHIDGASVQAVPFIKRFRLVGRLLRIRYGDELIASDRTWVSDTVRGWCAMGIGGDLDLSFSSALRDLRPFVRDHHFAVREWAWLALRPRVVADPDAALSGLRELFQSTVPYERRLAVEVTRPRGVWGSHCAAFKARPEAAERFLSNLRCDDHPYVRKAVGNWLNDAGYTRPDWVLTVTRRWTEQCDCHNTSEIVRRGLRSFTQPTGPSGPCTSVRD